MLKMLLLAGALAAAPVMPEIFEPGLVSTGQDESHIVFTPDGQTLYFLRNTPDFGHWTVLVSTRLGDSWSPPEIAPFSDVGANADVFVTRDGRFLFFISTRSVDGQPKSDTDIWMMKRRNGAWSAPRHVPELSSDGNEWFPTMTTDGWIYFGSERSGGYGQSDLWRARWLGDRFSEPENLGPAVNTPQQEIEPLVSDDGRSIIFAGRRASGPGSYDLFVTYSCDGAWTEPRPLPVNSQAWEFAPRLSPDGRTFYFTSNRRRPVPERIADTEALSAYLNAPGNGLRDIYMVPTSALRLTPSCGQLVEQRPR